MVSMDQENFMTCEIFSSVWPTPADSLSRPAHVLMSSPQQSRRPGDALTYIQDQGLSHNWKVGPVQRASQVSDREDILTAHFAAVSGVSDSDRWRV